MSDLQLVIVTPQGKSYSGPITQVVAPGDEGGFTVLRGHAPLIAALGPGVVRVQDASGEKCFVLEGGFLEVRKNEVVILSSWCEPATNPQNAAEILKARRAAATPAAPAKPH